jgi:NitT/TauT family transport system ATP-binding protein
MAVTDPIVITHLCKDFKGKKIIDHLSFNLEAGKIYSLLAPSGAGKTTLLRLIAGLDLDYQGEIRLQFPHEAGEIGFIFQEPSIFPWLTVMENLLFGVSLKNNRALKDSALYEDILSVLNLRDILHQYPKSLSGGQKQRTVFGRVMILQPKLLLCDEPFTSLDIRARKEMQQFLLAIQRRYKPTVLFVTHSLEEAVAISDTILHFDDSPLRQLKALAVPPDWKVDGKMKDSEEFLKFKIANIYLQ